MVFNKCLLNKVKSFILLSSHPSPVILNLGFTLESAKELLKMINVEVGLLVWWSEYFSSYSPQKAMIKQDTSVKTNPFRTLEINQRHTLHREEVIHKKPTEIWVWTMEVYVALCLAFSPPLPPGSVYKVFLSKQKKARQSECSLPEGAALIWSGTFENPTSSSAVRNTSNLSGKQTREDQQFS